MCLCIYLYLLQQVTSILAVDSLACEPHQDTGRHGAFQGRHGYWEEVCNKHGSIIHTYVHTNCNYGLHMSRCHSIWSLLRYPNYQCLYTVKFDKMAPLTDMYCCAVVFYTQLSHLQDSCSDTVFLGNPLEQSATCFYTARSVPVVQPCPATLDHHVFVCFAINKEA